MVIELGLFALIVSCLLAAAQAFFGLAGAHYGNRRWMAAARPAVTGQWVFIAEEVLAKHDENYMPPEVKDSLKPHMDAAQAMNQGSGT
jgi:hypothetical protein